MELTHAELRALAYSDGEANIRLSLVRQSGSNVIDIKEAVLPIIDQINRDILHPEGLQIDLSNDDVQYVENAVANVVQNILRAIFSLPW